MTFEFSGVGRPAVDGLFFRPYRGEVDIPAMAHVANACSAADGLEVKRDAEQMARDYASFNDCDPHHDVRLVEVHGELVAYTRVWRYQEDARLMLHSQLGFVRPDWQGRGIGRSLQKWIEQRHREVAAQHAGTTHQHQVFVQQSEVRRRALIEAAGYTPERHFFEMLHSDLEHPPSFRLPDGLELRPVLPAHHRLIWDTHREALRDHWGIAQSRPEDFQRWVGSKLFQPQRWQIAWDVATDTIVGQVKTWIDEDYNRMFDKRRGYTEHISVARPWRRRGVARALVAQSLRTLAEAGMTESHLGVDSDSLTGAVSVYEDCGFRVTKRNTTYRKPLVPNVAARGT
ncbi:GNAT family N-acetyltransferase [Variovorax sp. OV329]|uniref:GNAT family N-acetyltransferase n=1 Tax=Variovorax sp. OV329 TaxID=1882825 RepID=UPI0008EABC87|nr:GNAT family N-acetyltransferase [Variovorax sp. OV329]SFM75734.1 Ribosomal protein S18 acetylase RimI [Variovorax sp. OV329]